MDDSAIIKFIKNEMNLPKNISVHDINLIELGLDSLLTMRLVAYLEKEYNIAIPDEEVIPENVSTLQNLIRVVSKCIK